MLSDHELAILNSAKKVSANPLVEEQKFVQSFTEAVDHSDTLILKETRLTEEAAHHYAYKNNPSVIELLEEDDVKRQYRVIPINSGTDRIVGEIYVPVQPKNNQRVYVNFRGTHSGPTAVADLEDCPGEKSFQKNKATIMAQVNKAIGEVATASGKPVNTIFSGHSLGGAYAQQAATEAMRYASYNLFERLAEDPEKNAKAMGELIEAESAYHSQMRQKYPSLGKWHKGPQGMPSGIAKADRENFKRVSTISINVINSAGVSHIVEDYSNRVSGVLADNGTKTKARYGMIDGDGVQRTGQGSALSAAPKSDVVVTKLYKEGKSFGSTIQEALMVGAAVGVVGGIPFGIAGGIISGIVGFISQGIHNNVKAHTTHHFDDTVHEKPRQFPKGIYEIFRNDTPEGFAAVRKKLTNKSSLLQNVFIKSAQSLLYAFTSRMSTAKKMHPEAEVEKKATAKMRI